MADPAQPAPAAPAAGETAAAPRAPAKGRIFVKLGQQDGVDEAMLRGALATHAPGTEVLAVDVRQTHSFVEVPPDAVEGAVTALNGKELAGKPVAAERARRRRR